ncbi:MAG: hypothetical protein IPJ28_22070 [Betaproteobacteria bacterium]|nr:hypothetical protein [Betaproteobacteria bacterium]
MLVGFAIAPSRAALNIGPLLDEARIFVDIALGLVLFDLGRRMDLAWVKRDWSLAATFMGESPAASGLVFAALHLLGFLPLKAGIAARSRWRPLPPWCCWWPRTRARTAR